ncbi:MAG TPA: histidinol dehydrogenase [Polyangia bacterium]|nr:histidinol dehydrogenase [Polyangia bacterium]
MVPLRLLLPGDPDRQAVLARLFRRESASAPEVLGRAQKIIDTVRRGGDRALRELTRELEGRELTEIEIRRDAWDALADRTPADVQAALSRAHERIRRFHDEEAARLGAAGFLLEEGPARLGLRLTPLQRVGLYAPGGTARYPSSVLMGAAAARAAGVGELLMTTPGPSPEVLHAARVAGVDRVFALGGAQAIAAFAHGTESVPRVDKIIGPGNAYVAAAKRLVFGDVAIDQVAGPSEILILATPGGGAAPAWIAADLLSQAEHDTDAYAVLVTPSETLARAVAAEVARQLADLPRRDIAAQSLAAHGAAVVVGSLDEAIDFAERFAPEHLELLCEDARAQAGRIRSAGALFIGPYTPEAAGDYYAGPNHVLPTGGAARFGSPLGVHDFLKRTSILEYGAETLAAHAADIRRLAEVEGLDAHGRAVALRTASQDKETAS